MKPSPAIDLCKQEALLLAPSMMERSLREAVANLEATERRSRSMTRRMLFADARAALDRHAAVLRTEFPTQLLQAVMRALQQDDEEAERSPETSEETILALLEDAEVAHFVEGSRLQQTALPIVEQELNELDSLVSSALGLPVVRADLNPFRPEVLCRVLLDQLVKLPESSDFVSHWLRSVGRPFAEEMRGLYQALVDLLTRQGVEEARYRLRLSVGAGGGSSAPAGNEPMSGASDAGASRPPGSYHAGAVTAHGGPNRVPVFVPRAKDLSQARPMVDPTIMREFLYRARWLETHDEVLNADFYEAVSAQIRQLDAIEEPFFDIEAHERDLQAREMQDVMERGHRFLNVEAALPPEIWGEMASAQARTRTLMRLKAGATRISQVLGLDAVRLLINQVADDGRILPPLRETFVVMEPALLRTAMAEPRFFGDGKHPARVLMEAMAQRSFQYNDEFASEFQEFMQPVRAAVRQLLDLAAPVAADYQNQHEQLEATWEEQDERDRQAREQAVDSMQFAQERQALADRIAMEFNLRSDLVGVPVVVANFLYLDWSLVIAHAQLTQAKRVLDPGGYLAVVSDLLWSVSLELTMRDPARLFEVVPAMLTTLRRGLDMLGKDTEDTQPLFDALLRYHNPVLQLRRTRSARDMEESGLTVTDSRLVNMLDSLAEEAERYPAQKPLPRSEGGPWLGRHEREAAGFEDSDGAALQDEVLGITSDVLDKLSTIGVLKGQTLDRSRPPEEAALQLEVSEEVELGPVMGDEADATEPADKAEPVEAGLAPQLSISSQEELLKRLSAEADRLRTGDWVDLYVQTQWRRAQLSWTSDNRALFMFVSQGGRAHGMTRRSCEKLMLRAQLIPVNMDPVVERALRRLSEEQDRDEFVDDQQPSA